MLIFLVYKEIVWVYSAGSGPQVFIWLRFISISFSSILNLPFKLDTFSKWF